MQVHPIYEENRRLRAENERLRRLIREQTKANMRRYAAAYRAKEDRMRRGLLRVRICWNAVCRAAASAGAFARDLFDAMPMSAQCIIGAFSGGYSMCVLLTIAMEVWLACLS